MPVRNHRPRPVEAVFVLSALLTACGGSEDDGDAKPSGNVDAGASPVEAAVAPSRVSAACEAADEDDCYAANGLLGTWKCVTDEITVGANGLISLVSSDGQQATGCIACDGTFQAESTADSGGSPSVFSIVDGTLAANDEETSTVGWDFCNEVDTADACTRAPERGTESARCYLELSPGSGADGGTTPPASAERVAILIAEMRTPTTIEVAEGDTVTIIGEGEIQWYTGKCDNCSSTPVGSGCPTDDRNFLVRGIRCWSLVAWIGDAGEPFYVGESSTFVAAESGTLYLGVNDDNFVDNTGAWTAYVDVQPAE